MPAPVSEQPHRPPFGLEWVLLRLMPVLGFSGVLLPLMAALLANGVLGVSLTSQQGSVFDFWWMVITVVYWALFVTTLAGCCIAWAFSRGKTFLFPRARDDAS